MNFTLYPNIYFKMALNCVMNKVLNSFVSGMK